MGGLNQLAAALIKWSVLQLAMGIILCKAADISIQVGDLGTISGVTTEGLQGVMSEQGIWWLLSSSSHSEDFLRFMVWGALAFPMTGSLREHSMQAGDLLATRDASIAEYHSHQHHKLESGNLDITAWMLAFHCVESPATASTPTFTNPRPCTSIAPVAIVPHNSTFDDHSTSAQFTTAWEFTSVWDKLVPGNNLHVVANSITANLVNVSKDEVPIAVAGSADGYEQLSLKVLSNIKGIEHCPSPAMVAVRSSLDAAYNKGPYACHPISPNSAQYLLVLGMQEFSPDNIVEAPNTVSSASDSDGGESPANCIKQWLHTNSPSVELGKCQSSPLLAYLSNDNVFVACLNPNSTTCLQLIYGNETSACEERMSKFFTAIFNKSSSSTTAAKSQDFEERDVSAFNYIISGSSNFGLGTGSLCETAAGFINMNINLVQSPTNYNNNPVAVHPPVLGLLFRGLINRYTQAHGDAFLLQQGPPTDFFTATIALVGAAISVLSATVPVTNSLLRLLIRVSGSLHGSSYRYKSVLVLAVCILNVVVVAFVTIAAVVGLIMSEKQREEEFSTWALITETVLVNTMGLQLQALYVVQGKSVYKSKLLVLVWVLISILLFLVGGMTYGRCRDVLLKLQVIKQKASSAVAQVDDYKAIEMGMAEYMELLADGHEPEPDDAAAAPRYVIQMTALQTSTSPDTHEQLAVQTTTPPDVVAHAANLRFRTVANAVRTALHVAQAGETKCIPTRSGPVE